MPHGHNNNSKDMLGVNDILQVLRDIAEKNLERGKLLDGKKLENEWTQLTLEQLALDSLEQMTLLVELENRLKIKIENALFFQGKTLLELAQYLSKLKHP